MARNKGRFDPKELEGDPRFQDESDNLWSLELGEVPRGLLSSALRCFAANGYHATTTRDISTVVGLSPAALYVYYESKELVLYEIIRTSHERVLATVIDPRIQEIPDATQRLSELVSRYTAWHARHHVAARVAQYELAGLTEEHYEQILKLRHLTNDLFRKTVAEVVHDDHVSVPDINRLVRAILSLSIDLVRWYRLNGPDTPEELGDFYASLTLRMLNRSLPAGEGPGADFGSPDSTAVMS